jgi:predicted metal-dependent HD superfamily phosphohydrolase
MLDIHCAEERQVRQEVDFFRARAVTTLSRNGVKTVEECEEIANALLAMYSGRKRHYHTFVHINMLYRFADKYFPDNNCRNSLEAPELLAILFHDCIYVPGQVDNEGRSIDVMIAIMAGYGVPLTEYCWASRIIRETANFLEYVEDNSTHAVLDLDLVAFAQPWDDFLVQNTLIGKEFPGVPNTKRADFMQQFLNKNRVYYKLKELEDCASANISKYVTLLRGCDVSGTEK